MSVIPDINSIKQQNHCGEGALEKNSHVSVSATVKEDAVRSVGLLTEALTTALQGCVEVRRADRGP
jgi:hypothetical protein